MDHPWIQGTHSKRLEQRGVLQLEGGEARGEGRIVTWDIKVSLDWIYFSRSPAQSYISDQVFFSLFFINLPAFARCYSYFRLAHLV